MSRTFTANAFSAKSLRALQKELKTYRDSLQGKMEKFIALLLEEGIMVAQSYAVDYGGAFGTHQMARYVFFDKEPISTVDGKVYGVMFGRGDDIPGEYYVNDGNGHYTLYEDSINALMALEFGTAAYALPAQDAFGVTGGRGTKAIRGHENDEGWYIVTRLDGKGKPAEWKHATAITPTRPMYQAGLAMYQKIKDAAITVFRS